MQAFVLIYFLFSTSGRFFIWLVLFSTTDFNFHYRFYFPLPIIELISTHYYFSAMFSTTTWESDFIFHYQAQEIIFSTTDFVFHYWFCFTLSVIYLFDWLVSRQTQATQANPPCFPLPPRDQILFSTMCNPGKSFCFPLPIFAMFSTSHLVFYLRSVLYYR